MQVWAVRGLSGPIKFFSCARRVSGFLRLAGRGARLRAVRARLSFFYISSAGDDGQNQQNPYDVSLLGKNYAEKGYSAPFYKENKTADLLGTDYKSPLFQATSQPFQPRVSTFSVRKIKENY